MPARPLLGLLLLAVTSLGCGRSCSASAGPACGRLDPEHNIPACEEACARGDGDACETTAMLAGDPARALDFYDKGCRLGTSGACSEAHRRFREPRKKPAPTPHDPPDATLPPDPALLDRARRAAEKGCELGQPLFSADLCLWTAVAYLGVDSDKARAAHARACALDAAAALPLPVGAKIRCPALDEALVARAAEAHAACARADTWGCAALGDALLGVDDPRSAAAYAEECARRGFGPEHPMALTCVSWLRLRADPPKALDPASELEAPRPPAAGAPKPARINIGAITVTGSATADAVKQAVLKLEPDLRACHKSPGAPGVLGRVTASFHVDRRGDAAIIQNGGSDLPDRAAVQCVMRVIERLHLDPAPTDLPAVVVPILFSRG